MMGSYRSKKNHQFISPKTTWAYRTFRHTKIPIVGHDIIYECIPSFVGGLTFIIDSYDDHVHVVFPYVFNYIPILYPHYNPSKISIKSLVRVECVDT